MEGYYKELGRRNVNEISIRKKFVETTVRENGCKPHPQKWDETFAANENALS